MGLMVKVQCHDANGTGEETAEEQGEGEAVVWGR